MSYGHNIFDVELFVHAAVKEISTAATAAVAYHYLIVETSLHDCPLDEG